MSRVLVSGSLAYDRIMDFPGHFRDSFLPHKLHAINVSFGVEGVDENFGGCAGNIAYNLALLGEEPRIISTAGSDFGAYRKHLEGRGIATDSIHIDTSKLTSSAYILTDKADNQIAAFAFGAGGMPYGVDPEVSGARCAIIGAGNAEDMRSLPRFYRERGIPYFFDPAQGIPILSADDLKAGIEGAEGVFGNDYEIEMISKKTLWSEKELLAHTKVIVVTLGESGSRIMTKESTKHVGAVHVTNAVDPTGAGDAFRAGYIAGYVRNVPPEECAALGATVAAYAVEKYGTQNHTFTVEELEKRYDGTFGKTLAL